MPGTQDPQREDPFAPPTVPIDLMPDDQGTVYGISLRRLFRHSAIGSSVSAALLAFALVEEDRLVWGSAFYAIMMILDMLLWHIIGHQRMAIRIDDGGVCGRSFPFSALTRISFADIDRIRGATRRFRFLGMMRYALIEAKDRSQILVSAYHLSQDDFECILERVESVMAGRSRSTALPDYVESG